MNDYDCGIFLLHYIEKFLKAPDEIFEKNSRLARISLNRWFNSTDLETKRIEIAKILFSIYEQNVEDGILDEANDLSNNFENDDIEILSDEDENQIQVNAINDQANNLYNVISKETTSSNNALNHTISNHNNSNTFNVSRDDLMKSKFDRLFGKESKMPILELDRQANERDSGLDEAIVIDEISFKSPLKKLKMTLSDDLIERNSDNAFKIVRNKLSNLFNESLTNSSNDQLTNQLTNSPYSQFIKQLANQNIATAESKKRSNEKSNYGLTNLISSNSFNLDKSSINKTLTHTKSNILSFTSREDVEDLVSLSDDE